MSGHTLSTPERIIPAYAGSTVGARPWPSGRADHPRIRGEHPSIRMTAPPPRGSSPHTRGALTFPFQCCGSGGIIPAYAGSTPGSSTPAGGLRDHPRIRGEHFLAVSSSPSVKGSSPHTRGAHDAERSEPPHSGIIPAYAGSTDVPAAGSRSRRGSSPHTRGAP